MHMLELVPIYNTILENKLILPTLPQYMKSNITLITK